MARVEPRGSAYAASPETQSTTSLALVSSSPTLSHKISDGNTSLKTSPATTVDLGENGLLYGKVPKNYTFAAWISCIFGFTPIGIVAVVFSYKAKKALHSLNMQAAHHFAKRARYYTKASVYVGVLVAVIIILALRTAWSLDAL